MVSFRERNWLEPKGWEASGVGSGKQLNLEVQLNEFIKLNGGSSRSFTRAGTGSDLNFRKTSLETWTLQNEE